MQYVECYVHWKEYYVQCAVWIRPMEVAPQCGPHAQSGEQLGAVSMGECLYYHVLSMVLDNIHYNVSMLLANMQWP